MINAATEENREENLRKILVRPPKPKPPVPKICLNCQADNIEERVLRDHLAEGPLRFQTQQYVIPTKERFFGEEYPIIYNTINACLACGFAWTAIDISSYKEQLEKYGEKEKLTE